MGSHGNDISHTRKLRYTSQGTTPTALACYFETLVCGSPLGGLACLASMQSRHMYRSTVNHSHYSHAITSMVPLYLIKLQSRCFDQQTTYDIPS